MLDNELLKQAREAGIDLDLIDTNLALRVEDRWRQHDGAFEWYRWCDLCRTSGSDAT